MTELTKKREKVLREFLNAAVVPLIEDVLVKKLGQAMSYAKEQYKEPKREWVGLTDEEKNNCLVEADPCECLASHEAYELMTSVENKLKDKNK